MTKEQTNVTRFTAAVTALALEDAKAGIPERHKSNTSTELLKRLAAERTLYRTHPRIGDKKYLRSLYTAVHWLYKTEANNNC